MKSLKMLFALTATVLFITISCTKENLTTTSQVKAEVESFENAIDERQMVPSSELYGKECSKDFLKQLENVHQDNAKTACPDIISIEIQHHYSDDCMVQLATKSRRDAGQTFRIIHYTPQNGVEYDWTSSVFSGDDCSIDGLNFSIPRQSLSVGNITTYFVIMDGQDIVKWKYVVWKNCEH